MKRKLTHLAVALALIFSGLTASAEPAEASGAYQCNHPAQGIHYLTTSPTYGYLYHSIQRWSDGSQRWSLNTVYDYAYGKGYVRLYGVVKSCGYVSV